MSTIAGLVDSFSEFKEFKNIDRVTLMRVLEDVFRNALRRKYGSDENFDIVINTDKGDFEIFWNRLIVDDCEVENPNIQIGITEARKLEDDYELGEDATELLSIEHFGRRAILAIRQTLMSRVLELEKAEVIKKYQNRVGEIITGEVYQIWKKEIMVLDDEGNELILPRNEMIPSDFFKKGEFIRAVVLEVRINDGTPKIIISRTAPVFLERLFELEVPEILDGLITIKNVVREPGERAKVAVESYDERIDPVGACVGMRGARIHGIVRELRNENIDVINFTTNTSLYIQRALSPAKISTIRLEDNKAYVTMPSDQVSYAIGKGGFNIRLAGKLTGYEIEVFRETTENEEVDIDLEEFLDEIEEWIINEFKAVGLDTAKAVLEKDVENLVLITDLEEETIIEVKKILEAEFEN